MTFCYKTWSWVLTEQERNGTAPLDLPIPRTVGEVQGQGARVVQGARPPPPSLVTQEGFEGIVGDAKWIKCPYGNHEFANTKALALMHLSNCRKMYLEEMEKVNKPVEISVCKYDSSHHVRVEEIKEHELTCSGIFGMVSCLERYIERTWASKKIEDLAGPEKDGDDEDGALKLDGQLGGGGPAIGGGGQPIGDVDQAIEGGW